MSGEQTQAIESTGISRRRKALTLGLVIASAGIAYSARHYRAIASAPSPQILLELPKFQLTTEHGTGFANHSLAGHAWVANFIFTSCTQTCPKLTARMVDLQTELGKTDKGRRIRLLSITVDPETDTPAVLAAYASKNGADPTRWSFLTGDATAVKDVVMNGFKMTIQRTELDAGAYDILHGNWFALGDARGYVRGFEQVETTEDARRMAAAILTLEGEGSR